MTKSRMEAFSDAVIAIIITIMVIEFHPPAGSSLSDLAPMVPKLISYILSFVYIGIYWNNHHHLLQAVQRVTGLVLWANLSLLFGLSLIPFTTAWMGTSKFAQGPVLTYGAVLLISAIAYYLLVHALMLHHEKDSVLHRAIQNDVKGKASMLLYVIAMGLSYLQPIAACLVYALVAVMWLIPDRRIERVLAG